MSRLVLFVVLLVGMNQVMAAMAKIETSLEAGMVYLDLPKAAGYSDVSADPLQPIGFSVGASIKAPLVFNAIVVTPGIIAEGVIGGDQQRLYQEWAYAHTDFESLGLRPSVTLGYQFTGKHEIGVSWSRYSYRLGQGFERWSKTNHFRHFRVRGDALGVYYRRGEMKIGFIPFAHLTCPYGAVGMVSFEAAAKF